MKSSGHNYTFNYNYHIMSNIYCHFCELSIYSMERAYTTCDKCQIKACRRCYSTGIIPICTIRINQKIYQYCPECYLEKYTGKNYWHSFLNKK